MQTADRISLLVSLPRGATKEKEKMSRSKEGQNCQKFSINVIKKNNRCYDIGKLIMDEQEHAVYHLTIYIYTLS